MHCCGCPVGCPDKAPNSWAVFFSLPCVPILSWVVLYPDWSVPFQRHVWAQPSRAPVSYFFLRTDTLPQALSLYFLGILSCHALGVLPEGQETSRIKSVPQKCLFPHEY